MQKQSEKQSLWYGTRLQQAHLHVSLESLCSLSTLLSSHAGRVVLGELHLHIQQPAAQSVVPFHQLPPHLHGLQPALTRQQMCAPTLYKLCNALSELLLMMYTYLGWDYTGKCLRQDCWLCKHMLLSNQLLCLAKVCYVATRPPSLALVTEGRSIMYHVVYLS